MLKDLVQSFAVFVSTFSPRLREMQLADFDSGLFDRHLHISTEEAPLRSPYVTGGEIHFSETFLNFLWSVCFYLCTITEILIVKDKDPDFHGELEQVGLVDEAHKMINWALNLRFRYFPWPIDVCNPYTESENHNFVRLVFQRALAFIFFHEYAHRKLGHTPTSDEAIRKMQETEADNYSLETVYAELEDDDERTLYVVGVACVGITTLYTVASPSRLQQSTHPDIDVRLFNHLEFFRLENSNLAHYVHRLLTVGLYGFIHTYKLEFDRDRVFTDTWEHVLYLTNIVEKAKFDGTGN